MGLFFGGKAFIDTTRYRKIISGIEIRTPNFIQIQDGTFNGFFNAIFVSADVDVTIENHTITEIVINEHYFGRNSAVDAEAVIVDVVDSQSLEVDTVSGATNSSLVILKAIQLALESGIN
ncbi:MAG: FMN-binding protein [Defluviitaleaceae bacterium]|nr:FMN-binding protein [Defluviitaleaceae bacterium]